MRKPFHISRSDPVNTVYQDSGGPPSLKYEYTYDAVGNRTEKEETDFESPDTNEYTYNYNTNNNRLTGITETGETYTYNDRGDLTSINSGYTFNYDKEGRLEEIIEAVGEDTNKFEFSYTSEGRRFRKIHSVDTGGVVTADTTYYVYDGMFAVAELNGHLDLKSKYIYTNGMLVGRIDSSGEFYQYFHDGLGSITMICDSSGAFQNLYTYDDFGDFRKNQEEIPNHYCYTGQERDENPSGLYNLRARYYAAGIGRFTQEDPVFGMKNISSSCRSSSLSPLVFDEPQLINPYVYVTNNPIIWIDITGLALAAPGYRDPCESLVNCFKNVSGVKLKGLEECTQNRKDCLKLLEDQEKCKEFSTNVPAFETLQKLRKAKCWKESIGCNIKVIGKTPIGYTKCWFMYAFRCFSDYVGVPPNVD